MNSLYDVYVKLFGASIINESGYNKEKNTIEYITDKFKLMAYNSTDSIMVDFSYENQLFSFMPPNYENLCALITELDNGDITIKRISEKSIRLDGYDTKDGQKFNKVLCVICIIIANVLTYVGLINSVDIIIESLITNYNFSRYLTALDYIALVIMGVHIAQYGLMQHKYKKNIIKLIFGCGLSFFFSSRMLIVLLGDSGNLYWDADYITFKVGVYGLFAGIGIYFLSTCNVKIADRVSFLTVIPDLSANDADTIINYMNKVCKDMLLDYDKVVSIEDSKCSDIDVYMRYCAEKLCIPVSNYLTFKELYNSASRVTRDLFWTSDVAKYFYIILEDKETYN